MFYIGSVLKNRSGAVNSNKLKILAPVAAVFYPYLLMSFHSAVTAMTSAQDGGKAVFLLGAVGFLLLACSVPVVALVAASKLSAAKPETLRDFRARRVAYMAVAAPVFYTFTGVILFMLGNPLPDHAVVTLFWLACLGYIAYGRDQPIVDMPERVSLPKLRSLHKILAVALMVLFIAGHLGNHVLGLFGPELHGQAMKLLRVFYRAPLIEPLLLAGFLVLIFTGGKLALRFSAKAIDPFKSFQIASGVYLLFFLVSHVNAVLMLARTYLDIDSDWAFASGAPTGLLLDAWNIRLVPLYGYAVFFAVAHPVCGLRILLLTRGVSINTIGNVFLGGILAAITLSLLITLALCGMRVSL